MPTPSNQPQDCAHMVQRPQVLRAVVTARLGGHQHRAHFTDEQAEVQSSKVTPPGHSVSLFLSHNSGHTLL